MFTKQQFTKDVMDYFSRTYGYNYILNTVIVRGENQLHGGGKTANSMKLKQGDILDFYVSS
jgi:hypothetical protein